MVITWSLQFLNEHECKQYRDLIDREINTIEKVWLQTDQGIIDFLSSTLKNASLPFTIVGNQVTLGRYAPGEYLGRHADNPYQGDSTHVLLIYLNTVCCAAGGATKFYKHMTDTEPDIIVNPIEGNAVIFGIYRPHEASPITSGYKYIMGCELNALNALNACIH